MANFVEFEYDEAVMSININNVDCISLYLCDTGKNNISISFNSDDVPFNIVLNSKEEAKALYDLLRGKKDIFSDFPKGSSGQVLDDPGLYWRDQTPEEKEQEEHDEKKQLLNNIDICKDCGAFIKGLNFCTKCSVLGKIREEASKRKPPIKDPDSIPVTIECGEFFEIPKGMDIKDVMDFYNQCTKPFQDKLDRIRGALEILNIREESLFGAIYKDATEAWKDEQFISNGYRLTIKQIKAILDEGEE